MADNLVDDEAIRKAVTTARTPSNLVTEEDVYQPSIAETLYDISAAIPSAVSRYVSSVPERFSAATERVSQMSPYDLASALGSSAKQMIVDPAIQAATLPGRAYRGEIQPGQEIPEALNFTGMLTLGGIPASALERSGGMMLGTSGTRMAPEAAAVKAAKGITAYHGSPHEFEQFDTSKIGTGEGAQAYGHGLYFAEAEPVAKGYRERLTKQKKYDPDYWSDKTLPQDLSSAEETELRLLGQEMRTVGNLRNEKLARWKQLYNIRRNYQDALETQSPKGHMYEVNINAHPDHFLDWDKPFDDQSPNVRKTLTGLVGSGELRPAIMNLKGENIHSHIQSKIGGDPEQASKFLHENGIKGIKYLDAGSRGQGEGTSNYVVFDPKDIEIMRRYARGGDVRAHFAEGGGSNITDRQVTGDPIVDALIVAREKGNQPFVEAKPYDLSSQPQLRPQAAMDLVDRNTQNISESDRTSSNLSNITNRVWSAITNGRNFRNDMSNAYDVLPNLSEIPSDVVDAYRQSSEYAREGIENMKKIGSPATQALGAGQYLLGEAGAVFSPVTGLIHNTIYGPAKRYFGAPVAERFETAANMVDPFSPTAAIKAGATFVAPTLAMATIPSKAGAVEKALQIANETKEAKAITAAEDASKAPITTTTVDPAIEKAQQANKDLAPEAIAKTVAVEPTVTPPKDAEHAQITEVGHEMGTERGERKIIKETSIRLTPEEKAIVNSFESPSDKAKIAGAIRATKARYPVSDGWLPLELVGAELNEKGLPELQWKQPAYGFNRNLQDVDKVVRDSSGNPITYPQTDRSGAFKLNDYGDPIQKELKWPVKEERSMKRGTPEYDKSINKATNNSFKEIEDVVKRAAEGDEAARVILRQVGWYREFMRKGFDERGGAYPAFSDILGATSPNTPVDQNYRYAVEAQQRFARGDFDPQVAFASNYKGSLTQFPEDQLIRREVIDPKTGELKQYGMNSRNAQMAMADLWRQQEEGQAPKARNFSGNLGGATDAATIDVWAARHIQRMLGRKRLPPPAEGGVKGKMMLSAPDNPVGPFGPMPMTLKAGGEFGFGQDMYGKLADKVNQSQILRPYLKQLGYKDITPMDIQALTWFIEKEHWTKNNWTIKAGEGESFEDEMSKFPSRRWQSGFSISQGDTPPTNEMMDQTRNVVEGSLKDDDNVMVYRVHPTYGRYGGYDERSFDVELTAKPDWNPTNWMASIISEAKKNNQYDVFFSKRLDPSEAKINPNSRPGVEIYFQNRKDMDEILPILDEFTRRGQDGFTFTTDLRLKERQAGGADTPDYVGVRLQYIPEIQMRFDDDFRKAVQSDPKAVENAMQLAQDNMQAALEALDRAGAKIVDARVHHYDTLAIGKESYDDFLNGITDPENASRTYEGKSRSVNPALRFGQPIGSHVEGRDRALREGYGQASADPSAAVEQPNIGLSETEKSRGGNAFASGGRSLGNNAIDNAIRMARQHFGFGGADRDAAEGSTYSGNVSHNTSSPSPSSPNDNTGGGSRSDSGIGGGGNDRSSPTSDPVREAIEKELPNKMTGVEGATPIGMPTSMKELMNASRAAKTAQDQQQADSEAAVRNAMEIAQGLRSSSFFSPTTDMGFNINPLGKPMGEASTTVGWNPTQNVGESIKGPVSEPDRSITGFNSAGPQSMVTQDMRDAFAMRGQPNVGAPQSQDIFSQAEIDKLTGSQPSTNVAETTTPVATQPSVERAMVFDPVTQGFVPVGSASSQATRLAQAESAQAARVMANLMPSPNAPMAAFPHIPTPDYTMASFNRPSFPHTPTPQPTQVASYDRPAFPHTQTPSTAMQGLSTVAPTATVASLYHPDSSVMQNAPFPMARPAEEAILQNVPLPPVVTRDPIKAAVMAAKEPVDPLLAGGADLAARKAAPSFTGTSATGVPMPTPRPDEMKKEPNFVSQIVDSIKADLAFKEGERINALEAAGKTATFPDYSTASDPMAAQREYMKSIGLDPKNPEDVAKVQARIIQEDGQDKVDYYTKTLWEALFGKGKSPTDQQNAPSAGGGGGGGGGGQDTSGSSVKAGPGRKVLYPYQTELGESANIPSLDGMSAEQWARQYAGGDLSRVHGSLDWSTGAPRVIYHL